MGCKLAYTSTVKPARARLFDLERSGLVVVGFVGIFAHGLGELCILFVAAVLLALWCLVFCRRPARAVALCRLRSVCARMFGMCSSSGRAHNCERAIASARAVSTASVRGAGPSTAGRARGGPSARRSERVLAGRACGC